MINLIKKIKQKNINDLKKESLIQELHKISLEIKKTNLWFQTEIDQDLIDACIYQREFLNSKYKYLLNKIKMNKFF